MAETLGVCQQKLTSAAPLNLFMFLIGADEIPPNAACRCLLRRARSVPPQQHLLKLNSFHTWVWNPARPFFLLKASHSIAAAS